MNALAGIRPILNSLPQIQSLPKAGPLAGNAPAMPAAPAAEPFDATLRRLVGEVNTQQLHAADAAGKLLAGENVPLHQTMIAIEEASVSFQLMVEVRNKLLDSYQEIMRMQV
jgi:flagellar hook-basal body complex protein FliE